ncbi:MAG: GyrI-like domain-containing protein [bacterium]|nr:GyrI-like domain-containing protein [bacterium]
MSIADELEFAEVEVSPVLAAQMPGQSTSDPSAISKAMGGAFDSLAGFLERHSLVPSGPPRAIYKSYGPEGTNFIVAMPIASPPARPAEEGPGFVDTLSGGKALRFTHHGPYQDLIKTYGRITEFMLSKGLMNSEADWARYMPMWEEYLNDPHTTREAALLTYIHLPLP